MELEDDLTAVIILVKSPGISSAEAMAVSLDSLRSATAHFEEQLSHTESSYTLVVNAEALFVAAGGLQGIHHALSTIAFFQAYRTSRHAYNMGYMPSALVPFDRPRFDWRGWHVDVARHFFSSDVILRTLRKITTLKFNKFHMHLTDDQGWRIGIPDLPRLESVGRTDYHPPQTHPSVSGSYSDEDIRRIVKYCESTGVHIVPEIDFLDMGAILASYPSLACNPNAAPLKAAFHKSGASFHTHCVTKRGY